MNIKKMNIDDLTPAFYNPRVELTKEDAEYKKLKKSIETFGYVEPIIFNEQTGTVVGGHQRLNVMKELGYKEIDVNVIDISLNKEKALNVALNKISGEFDRELLKDLMSDLESEEINLDLTGFDKDEMDALMTEYDVDDFFHDSDIDSSKPKEDETCPHCGEVI